VQFPDYLQTDNLLDDNRIMFSGSQMGKGLFIGDGRDNII